MTATASLRPDTAAALAGAGLDPARVQSLVLAALAEDLDGGVDVTSTATVPAGLAGRADVVARAAGVLAGVPVAVAVLELSLGDGLEVASVLADGDAVRPGDVVLTATGPVRGLLTAERTTLNLLCQLSGVATLTRAWVDALAGTGARVRDTRKTVPGLRALQKYAVRCGGGVNHRMSLSDAALVKDNHVLAAGGVGAAFALVRAASNVPVEVECDTVAEVAEAVDAGADLVLADNMAPAELAEAVRVAHAAGVRVEASGGLRLRDAAEVARTGVDYVAVGALTHSAPVLDLGFDLRPLVTVGESAASGQEGR